MNFSSRIVVTLLLVFHFQSARCQQGEVKILIIANNAYTGQQFQNLKGITYKDARALEKTFYSDVGIDERNMTVLFDQDHDSFSNALEKFRRSLQPEDSAIFYFSGHGFSAGGDSYLLPIKVSGSASTNELEQQSISLREISTILRPAKVGAAIIDACRTYYVPSGDQDQKDLEAPRSPGGMGLLLFLASADGQIASAQSEGGLSRFTNSLVSVMRTGQWKDLEDLFIQVRYKTILDSGQEQIPALDIETSARFPLPTLRIGASQSQMPLAQRMPNTSISDPPRQIKEDIKEVRDALQDFVSKRDDAIRLMYREFGKPLPESSAIGAGAGIAPQFFLNAQEEAKVKAFEARQQRDYAVDLEEKIKDLRKKAKIAVDDHQEFEDAESMAEDVPDPPYPTTTVYPRFAKMITYLDGLSRRFEGAFPTPVPAKIPLTSMQREMLSVEKELQNFLLYRLNYDRAWEGIRRQRAYQPGNFGPTKIAQVNRELTQRYEIDRIDLLKLRKKTVGYLPLSYKELNENSKRFEAADKAARTEPEKSDPVYTELSFPRDPRFILINEYVKSLDERLREITVPIERMQ